MKKTTSRTRLLVYHFKSVATAWLRSLCGTRYTIGSQDKEQCPYYDPPITAVDAEVRRLLEDYGKIPPAEVIPEVIKVRDRLWTVFSWPCVGHFLFIEFMINQHPSYKRVVNAVQNGARYLDIGSCFGQDLRKLISDGVPTDNTFVIEKEQGFLSAATDFFGDADRPPAKFICADVLDTSNADMNALLGTVDIIHVSMVLHVWDWNDQIRACERMVAFLKPQKGSLILGRLVGRLTACHWRGPAGKPMFKHNVESFHKLWAEVGRRTGTEWEVRAEFAGAFGSQNGGQHWEDPATRRLMFEVERL